MTKDKSIDELFEEYIVIGSKMPTQTADNMLIAYGFYKQATEGDNTHFRPNESSNVVQTIKYAACKRLMGMSQKEAKRQYVEHIKFMMELSKQEGRL